MADPARARRLAVRIREIVASALERQIKDPRLGMVTVTDARVTPDLTEATVYYTVYGDDAARADSARALESAKGVLRSHVGRQTGVKTTPTLTFIHDRLPDDARHIEDLLEVARENDARVALARETAVPAGDPDPYRTALDTADDDGAAGPADDAAIEPAGGLPDDDGGAGSPAGVAGDAAADPAWTGRR
jgi:ribosome-binding factor A